MIMLKVSLDGWGSEVEHQLGAGAAGYADEDAVLRRVLAAPEHGGAVLGRGCQHARLTGAAQAFAAGVVHIDAAVQQHLEDGLVGRDVEAAVLAFELHAEAAGWGPPLRPPPRPPPPPPPPHPP